MEETKRMRLLQCSCGQLALGVYSNHGKCPLCGGVGTMRPHKADPDQRYILGRVERSPMQTTNGGRNEP